MKKLFAEFFGTFWLVFGGCGSAIFAAAYPDLGIGFAGVALAFGLTVLTMAFAVGHISGGHFNPAVSFGLWAGGKFPAKELLGYIIAQLIGAIAAAGVLYLIVSGKSGFSDIGGFAANGYDSLSPDGYSMTSAFIAELVLLCARNSSTCPSKTSVKITAAASKYTCTFPWASLNWAGNIPGISKASTLKM